MDVNHPTVDIVSTSERDVHEIKAKIDELRAYQGYGHGPDARDKRYKHQGWVDALRWVLGSDLTEEP